MSLHFPSLSDRWCSFTDSKQLTKVIDDRVRFVQLAPGDSNHSPSCGLKAAISFTVRLERATRSVCLASVQFDDHSLVTPEAVRLNPSSVELEQGIEPRDRKVRVTKQSGEPLLELASNATARPVAEAVEAGSKSRGAPLSTMPFQECIEILRAYPMEVFRLADYPFQATSGKRVGDGEDGPGKRGYRDPSSRCDLVRVELRLVPSNCGAGSGCAWSRDLDLAVFSWPVDPPKFSRRAVA